ncbi:MAG: helix-turn-helix domain-containing protein [Planctomycetota bacterium]
MAQDRIHFPPEAVTPVEQRFRVLAVGHGQLDAGRREWVDNRRRTAPDGRPGVVLQFTRAGSGVLRDGRGAQPVGLHAGFCIRLPSDCAHGNPDGERWERLWLTLGGGIAQELAEALIDQAGGSVFGVPMHCRAPALLEELHGRCLREDPDHASIAAAAFHVFSSLGAELGAGDSTHPEPVVAALALLRRRIADPGLRLDDLAAAAGLSRHHFGRLFTSAVGEAPMRHLGRRRLRRAANMLRHSDLSVKEIAAACGWASRQRFSAAFTACYGSSPQLWRRGL